MMVMDVKRPLLERVRIASGEGGIPEEILNVNDYFGSAVASCQDLDGDGVRELVVGAKGDNSVGDSAGAVYMLYLKQGKDKVMKK